VYRILQETLTNVHKHAQAGRVHVRLQQDARMIICSVEDDGIGFDSDAPRQGHYGIVGLHEQAHLIGAHLRIDSAPGKGTTLTVTLRMAPEML